MHGVTTKQIRNDFNLQDGQTDIIAALVTVPTYLLKEENKTLNTPIPCRNDKDLAAYCGKNLPDFTAYDTVSTILQESGGATVYVINVFDENKHKTTVSETTVNLTNGKYTIDKLGISDIVVKNGDTVATKDIDYTVSESDEKTVIEVTKDGNLKDLTSVKIGYAYADVTKVTAADFVGTVDEDGIRSGAKAIYNIPALYGDDVNVIIAPTFSALKSVRDELTLIAEDFKARTFLDVPVGTRVNAAIQGRVKATESADLTVTSKYATIALPHVYRYNQYTDKNELRPLSPALAGMRVRLNKEQNIAKSLDNTVIKTAKGAEYPVEFILNKENTESNALNDKGIATVINYKGEYRYWGGRNCSYPSNSGIETFDSPVDTANFIEKTIQNGSFVMVGKSVNRAFIDNVLAQIQAKFNGWKNPENQLIYDGEVWYDESLNPAEELANGHIIFPYKFCPLCVAEHIEYYSYIDIQLITQALGE